MKRVFIVHGWEGNPKEPWFVWIKKELEKRKFKVFVPKMPNPDYPKINAWINYLKKQVKNPDKNTYFIGHSIGCQTILRYLEKLDKKIGGCVFVAGWFNLKLYNLETHEEVKTVEPWIKTPINFNKVKKLINKNVAIFSDNDPFVNLNEKNTFKKKLGSRIIIHHNKGHFMPQNIKNLPSAFNALLEISK